jgi:hypothetical protein
VRTVRGLAVARGIGIGLYQKWMCESKNNFDRKTSFPAKIQKTRNGRKIIRTDWKQKLSPKGLMGWLSKVEGRMFLHCRRSRRGENVLLCAFALNGPLSEGPERRNIGSRLSISDKHPYLLSSLLTDNRLRSTSLLSTRILINHYIISGGDAPVRPSYCITATLWTPLRSWKTYGR